MEKAFYDHSGKITISSFNIAQNETRVADKMREFVSLFNTSAM